MSNNPQPNSTGSLPPASMHRPPAGGNSAYGCFFALSVFLNLGLVALLVLGCMGAMFSGLGANGDSVGGGLIEKTLSGTGRDKVAIIQLDGVIMEGALSHVQKQIEQAAKDNSVKSVVLRINSPGGSITASDELYRRLIELRDGNPKKKYAPKPLVVSMASLAASGGYYVAMPGQQIFAEASTLTGSIGVYAALPNISGFAKKYEFGFNTIKAGDIKDSGSMFKEMSTEEYAVWQSMINQAYIQFTDLVVKHREQIEHKPLTKKFAYTVVKVPGLKLDRELPDTVQRNIADGGIWTAKEALALKLIDFIGTQEDAADAARKLAGISEDAKVIQYDKPKTFTEALFGVEARKPGLTLTGEKLGRMLTPRVWYLMPGADVAGLLATLDE